MSECHHTICRNNHCASCGLQIYAVDDRECGGCAHHKQLPDGGICRKHLMACWRGMHVTYKVSEGTCWTPKVSDLAPACS